MICPAWPACHACSVKFSAGTPAMLPWCAASNTLLHVVECEQNPQYLPTLGEAGGSMAEGTRAVGDARDGASSEESAQLPEA